MKSKISFFNKTVFQKNVKQYWPLWTIYTIILLLMGPISMWSQYKTAEYHYGQAWQKHMQGFLSPAIAMRTTVVVIFMMAIFTGMALFGYLYNQRACNMIHAMPVTRTQLYITNVITGLLFMWIPQIIRFVISLFICIANGMTDIKTLAIWLLGSMGISFLAYSIVCVTVMITGQMIALPICYIILNFLYAIIVGAFSLVTEFLAYGASAIEMFLGMKLWVLSPFICVFKNVYFDGIMRETASDYYCIGYEFHGAKLIMIYIIAAIALYVMGLFMYKHRKLEYAGNMLAVDILKPVCKWGGGSCIGFVLAEFIASLLCTVKTNVGLAAFLIIAIIIGAFTFTIMEMLIDKSFRVIRKRLFKEIGLFAIFMVVLYGGLYFNAQRITNIIPEISDVECAYVSLDYKVKFTGDDIQKVIDTQEKLLDYKGTYFAHRDDMSDSVYITYILKNGKTLNRCYTVPSSYVDIYDVCDLIVEAEKQPDNLLKEIFSFDPDQGRVTGGAAQQYDGDYNLIQNVDFGPKVAQNIYEAIKKDAQEGNLQKYNISYLYGYEGYNDSYNYDLSITISIPKGAEMSDGYSYYGDIYSWPVDRFLSKMENGYSLVENSIAQSSYETNISVLFGAKCNNIIKALEDNKIIESRDELIVLEDE